MWILKKSAFFKKQLITFAQNYRDLAGEETALCFIDAVEEALAFIKNQPLACKKYQDAQKHLQLQSYEFRRWSVKGFPHWIFFRIGDHQELFLEALYAYRMNMFNRMGTDL